MNSFLSACGVKGPWQLSIEGQGKAGPVSRSFESPFLVVGQTPEADLRLTGQGVDARHAYLQWLDGGLYGVDLGSRCGTFWEGQRRSAGWIEPGQVLQIGPHRLRFLPSDSGEAGQATRSLDGAELARVTLDILLRGIRSIQAHAQGKLSLIGSSAACQLRLLDPGVSPFHCSLLQTPAGVWIVDLLGQEGVNVNGARVRCARVQEGDEVWVGRTTIRFRIAGSDVGGGSQEDIRPEEARPCRPTGRCAPTPEEREPAPAPEAERGADTEVTSVGDEGMIPASSPSGLVERPTDGVAPMDGYGRSPQPSAEPPPGPEPPPVWGQPEPESSEERRSSYRYSVSQAHARLCWWEKPPANLPLSPSNDSRTYSALSARGPAFKNGTSEKCESTEVRRTIVGPQEVLVSHTCPVVLIDVSQSGLAVLGGTAPPADQRVWFRLEGRRMTEWVKLILVGRVSGHEGQEILRFAFRDLCPYELFKMLVIEAKPQNP